MARAEVTQSMRVGTFGDFVVMGCQYRDEAGDEHWYIAVLTGPDPVTRTYHIVGGELPAELTTDERDAVIQAIRCWESEPLSRPN
jgi:hypothetical protein